MGELKLSDLLFHIHPLTGCANEQILVLSKEIDYTRAPGGLQTVSGKAQWMWEKHYISYCISYQKPKCE